MEYAIGTTKLGIGEHAPKVMLDDVFLQRESRNVRRRLGYYEKIRGRMPALYDADRTQIQCPKYIYAVTGVNKGAKTFTISGNHASTIASPLRINGSTANDGLYTLVSATNSGGNTLIVVSEAVDSAVADGNVFADHTPILAYHKHIKEGVDTEYLLVCSAYHVLLWSQTNKTLTVKFTCTTPANVTYWSLASFQDMVYATNGDDLVQVWDVHTSPSGAFAPIEGVNGITVATAVYCTKAKYVYAYQGYLFLGHTYEDTLWRPRRIRWCDADDPTVWNENAVAAGDQGHKDLNDDDGFVIGFGRWSNYLEVAATKRMIRAWLTTTDTVFYFDRETIELGCAAPDSMVNDRMGNLYFLASDLTIRRLDTAEAIFKPVEQTVKGLNQAYLTHARAAYYPDADRLFFAVPTGDAETNDLVIELDPNDGDFYFHDIAVSAFGDYTRQETYTYDTLPYATYDDWGAAWLMYDTHANATGFPLLLCSDYDGLSYEWGQADKDAGESIQGDLVFGTSLDRRLHGYKRIPENITFIFAREPSGSTVSVYGKRDTESSWTTLGTGSLANTDNPDTVWVSVPCDLRARHFTFRVSSTDYFRFIGLYIPNYQPDGDR